MHHIISFMHISLDGFVAGPNGEMDWIKVDEDIFDHVGKRISACDSAIYGRITYEMMEGYWPTAAEQAGASKHDITHSAWYMQVHKFVLSETLKNEKRPSTTIINGNLTDKINEIKKLPGHEDILVFGSPTATHALMQQDLIDGYWLFVNPIILGKGIALFEGINDNIKLNLLSTHRFSNGVVELNYIADR